MNLTETDDLPRVMREISETMRAPTCVLTIHPENNEAPREIYVDGEAGIGAEVIECLLRELSANSRLDQGEHVWLSCMVRGTERTVLAMPVQQIHGHSRLVISTIFDALSDDARQEAEGVYLERRPFAVGYFRLWQLERTHLQRIDALEAALNRTDFGVLLLDRAGRLVFANDAAALILDESDGLRRMRSGIAGTGVQDGVRLQVAIDHVLAAAQVRLGEYRAPILKLARRDRPALIVSVMPAGKVALEPSDVAAILYVLDPAMDTDRLLQPVCKLYHLSPVETKLACLLTAGATLAEAASAIHVKEQTARSCLKQIFLKTDTNRQADLIRVLLSNLVRTTRAIPFEVF